MFVDQGRPIGHGRHGVEDGGQLLVVHLDQAGGLHGGFQIYGGHAGHFVAHVAHLVYGHDGLVVAGRGDSVRDDVQVPGRDHGLHAGQFLGFGRVDVQDPGVGQRALQQGPVEHVGKGQVIGVNGLSGGLVRGVQSRRPGVNDAISAHSLFLPS